MYNRKNYLSEPSYRHCDRKEHIVLTHRTPNKGRYCEHCKTIKPVNDKPHVKGWCCTDCINKKMDEKMKIKDCEHTDAFINAQNDWSVNPFSYKEYDFFLMP